MKKLLKYETFTTWWLYFGHNYIPFQKTTIYVVKLSYFKYFFNFFPMEYFLFGCFQFLMLYLHAGLYIFFGSFFLLKSTLKLRVIRHLSDVYLTSIRHHTIYLPPDASFTINFPQKINCNIFNLGHFIMIFLIHSLKMATSVS